jgi:hypothetical protein
MNLVRKILGPKSKYDQSLPYTYEARVPLVDGEEAYNSYFSDTICGLAEYLEQHAIEPETVRIYEIFKEQESQLGPKLYATADGKWLSRRELCESFKEHYPGHIQNGHCSFEDRDHEGCGP